MTLLTATEVRDHVETDVDDAALQRVIDRIDADLVLRAGPHLGPLTETLAGGTLSAFVSRPIASLTSVREGDPIVVATPNLTAEDDYRVWPAEGRIQRLAGSTFGLQVGGAAPARFAAVVEVVYTPVDDREQRRRVILELVRLDLAQSGRARESVGGDYRYAGLDYEGHREALIREIRPFLTLE